MPAPVITWERGSHVSSSSLSPASSVSLLSPSSPSSSLSSSSSSLSLSSSNSVIQGPRYYSVILSGSHFEVYANGSLFIKDSTEEDSGFYLCQAANSIGPGLSKVITLTVHGMCSVSHTERTFPSYMRKRKAWRRSKNRIRQRITKGDRMQCRRTQWPYSFAVLFFFPFSSFLSVPVMPLLERVCVWSTFDILLCVVSSLQHNSIRSSGDMERTRPCRRTCMKPFPET